MNSGGGGSGNSNNGEASNNSIPVPNPDVLRGEIEVARCAAQWRSSQTSGATLRILGLRDECQSKIRIVPNDNIAG
jgi:hypothetical protein